MAGVEQAKVVKDEVRQWHKKNNYKKIAGERSSVWVKWVAVEAFSGSIQCVRFHVQPERSMMEESRGQGKVYSFKNNFGS